MLLFALPMERIIEGGFEVTDKRCRQLEALSVEQLRSILQAELASDETDVELIKCVNAILDEGEGAIEFDVDAAWEEFVQVHASSEPLYTLDEEDVLPQETERPPQKRSSSVVRRLLPIAATIAILMGSMVTAQALGVDVFGVMARWTSEIFHFTDTSVPYAVVQTNPLAEGETRSYDTLQDALDDFGLDVPLAPTWLPERFAVSDITASSAPGGISINSVYFYGDDYLQISFHEVTNADHGNLEKDFLAAEDVVLGGSHHYILTDSNRIKVIWWNGELECHITGNITMQEIYKIIKSIYEDVK